MKQRTPFFLRTFTVKGRRIWLALFLLIILFLVLFSPEIQRKPHVALVERPLIFIMTSLYEGINGLFGGAVRVWDRYAALLSLREENERLNDEVRRLRTERDLFQEEAMAAGRMRQLLDLRARLPRPSTAAQVIGRDPTNWYRMVVLDKGEEEGAASNRVVVSPEGVVGRIIRTSPHSSRVLLISDRSSALAAMIQRNRVSGILQGGESGRLTLGYVPLDESVIVGDLVVTSGLEGIFPKGIPVGRVTRVDRKASPLFLTVDVVPVVDVSRLEEVWILDRMDFPDSSGVEGWEKTP